MYKVKENARWLAGTLKSRGLKIVSGGTVNHLMTVDLRDTDWTGKDLANALDEIGITVNKNTVPNDPQSPFVTSGIRIGTPAVTTRGITSDDIILVGHIIADLVYGVKSKEELRDEVRKLCKQYPLPYKKKLAKV
jgi:glycine hydroxymethyltransferase